MTVYGRGGAGNYISNKQHSAAAAAAKETPDSPELAPSSNHLTNTNTGSSTSTSSTNYIVPHESLRAGRGGFGNTILLSEYMEQHPHATYGTAGTGSFDPQSISAASDFESRKRSTNYGRGGSGNYKRRQSSSASIAVSNTTGKVEEEVHGHHHHATTVDATAVRPFWSIKSHLHSISPQTSNASSS